jgi:hypothetical protein
MPSISSKAAPIQVSSVRFAPRKLRRGDERVGSDTGSACFSSKPSTKASWLPDDFLAHFAPPTGLFVATVVGARKIRADAPPCRRSLRDPVAAAMRVAAGSWIPVFGVVVAMDVATALLALFALKQMRATYLGARTSGPSAELAPAASRRRMSRRTDQPLWRRCLSKPHAAIPCLPRGRSLTSRGFRKIICIQTSDV